MWGTFTTCVAGFCLLFIASDGGIFDPLFDTSHDVAGSLRPSQFRWYWSYTPYSRKTTSSSSSRVREHLHNSRLLFWYAVLRPPPSPCSLCTCQGRLHDWTEGCIHIWHSAPDGEVLRGAAWACNLSLRDIPFCPAYAFPQDRRTFSSGKVFVGVGWKSGVRSKRNVVQLPYGDP